MKKAAASTGPVVRINPNKHTCIEVSRSGTLVDYIPLDVTGIELRRSGAEMFDSEYTLLPDYPVEKAAQLYAGYAADLGGSPEAMAALAKLCNLTFTEIDMATAKKTATTTAKAEKAEKAKPAAKTAASAKTAKPAAKTAAPKVAKEPGAPRQSAAQLFKDLIMEGKKTDDAIFAEVQKKFGLDDNKKTYVKWYRNNLAKSGANPPAAK